MSVASMLSYAVGQCTYGVASITSWVPGGWGNASTWFGNAQSQGYPTSQTPVVGSIIAWGPNAGPADSAAGHVAKVVGIQSNGAPVIQEMNGGHGVGVWDTRPITAAEANAAQGYILPKGGLAGAATGSAWAGNVTAANQATTTAASTVPGAAGQCLSLGEMIAADGGNAPIIGGALAAVGAPVSFIRWMSQPCVYKRLLIQAGCVLLIWQGMKMASVPNPVAPVINIAKDGVKSAAAAAG
jgi:surface antigen